MLIYDKNKWEEVIPQPVNSLQMFITGNCNMRCSTCFFRKHYGTGIMSFETYCKYIDTYGEKVQKIIILGGEPTLHDDLPKMIEYNNQKGLKTTLYTNGIFLQKLEGTNLENTKVRISVGGLQGRRKSLANLVIRLATNEFNKTFVYMLDKRNYGNLSKTVEIVEELFQSKSFFISSIRDIVKSGSYWRDTEDTLSFEEYGEVVQDFLNKYDGKMDIHISRRGVLSTDVSRTEVTKCRFMNVLPDDSKIICPFDICKNITVNHLEFGERNCVQNSSGQCLLQKIVLKRKVDTNV